LVGGGLLMVHGGEGNDGTPLADTWALTRAPADDWHSPFGGAPPARTRHSAVYDEANGRVIRFGGLGPAADGGAGAPTSDVWQLSLDGGGGDWSPLATAGGPPPERARHAAVYDRASGRMVVFGGQGLDGGVHTDAWSLSLPASGTPTWSPLPGTVQARYGHVAAYDHAGRRMLIFGGVGASGGLYTDFWQLPLERGQEGWTEIASPGGASRLGGAAAFDETNRRMFVFGGLDSTSNAGNEILSIDVCR